MTSLKSFLELKATEMEEESQPSRNRVFLCRRRTARGDVLLTTPVLRAIKNKYPGSKIYYESLHPELLWRNPVVDGLNEGPVTIGYHRAEFCNFELRYENHPGLHIIDCFAMGAGFKPGEVKRELEMYPDQVHWLFAKNHIPLNAVAVAPGPGLWTGRNWKELHWYTICRNIMDKGFKLVLLGQETNYALPANVDLRGKTSYHQLAAAIKACRLFIGIDSFPFHVAGAMGVPRIGLFGITLHDLIKCDCPKTIAIQSDKNHPMTGVRHTVSTMHKVEPMAKNNNPMDTIRVSQVMSAIESQLYGT